MNGDSFVNIDLTSLFKTKLEKKFDFQMFLLRNKNYKSNNKLSKLSIKNQRVIDKGNLMNSGIYFFRKKFLKNIKKKNQSLEKIIYSKIINKGNIKGKLITSEFIDIGTMENLNYAKKIFYKNFIKPAAFFDRDGVINYDYGYVHKVKDFKLKTGAIKSIRYLNSKNYNVFIITNQAGIARGYYTEKQFISFSRDIKKILFSKKCFFNDIHYSPFLKGSKIKKYNKKSSLRKPGNKMIEDLKIKWPINLKKSFMIGDQKKDEKCARKSNLYFEFCSEKIFPQIKKLSKIFD